VLTVYCEKYRNAVGDVNFTFYNYECWYDTIRRATITCDRNNGQVRNAVPKNNDQQMKSYAYSEQLSYCLETKRTMQC